MSLLYPDTATPQFCTLSLHDALPISTILFNHLSCLCLPCETRAQPSNPLSSDELGAEGLQLPRSDARFRIIVDSQDRKSTRLNSSHRCISYAAFCLKKKKPIIIHNLL